MVRKSFVCLTVAALLAAPAFAAKGPRGKASKAGRTAATSEQGGGGLGAREAFAGLTEEERASVLNMALKSSFVKNNLSGGRYRVLGVDATAVKTAGGMRREAHTMILDVGKNKTYHVINDVSNGAPGNIIQSTTLDSYSPFTAEEYAEARDLMMKLDRVKELLKQPNMAIQDGFPPVQSPVAACADLSHRCVEMQVDEYPPGRNALFRLIVTVDLSTSQVVEVREPKSPITLAR